MRLFLFQITDMPFIGSHIAFDVLFHRLYDVPE